MAKVILGLALLVSSFMANAIVTMDVDKWYGQSGTYRCAEKVDCFRLYRDAEMRGETYYCNSVIIKENGKVVWYRNFYKDGPRGKGVHDWFRPVR